MSEAELNSYRFNSGKEPTDEMLAHIMHEVAQEAKVQNEEATKKYFENSVRRLKNNRLNGRLV